ncbi:hypothetical protein FRC91_19070 [Bradymonadales bacterium TMQ1]|nr:hypothetical protein FRC91_19070 [Bradymonadales bacterium TMQ1]
MTDQKTLLVPCPGCQAHVRVFEDIPRGACPFCGGEFGPAQARQARARVGELARGRAAGLAAASAMGLTLLAACEHGEGPTPEPDEAPAQMQVQEPLDASSASENSPNNAAPSGDDASEGESTDPTPDEDDVWDAPRKVVDEQLYGAPPFDEEDLELTTAPAPEDGEARESEGD